MTIGLGAFRVPKLFALGEYFLLATGQTNSFSYLSLSALVLAASILPWCVCMGATFPLMMAYIRERDDQSTDSFSFLYLANVLGAMSGTFLTAIVLVELLGFRHTLWIAAAGNFIVALVSGWLGWKQRGTTTAPSPMTEFPTVPTGAFQQQHPPRPGTPWLLFSTGFIAMALEVAWMRAFSPVLRTQVYSFAMIVFTYLGATFLGSLMYRSNLRDGRVYSTAQLVAFLAAVVFLPILTNDFRFLNWVYQRNLPGGDYFCVILLLASICPFCAALGYLTPCLIDKYAAGHPVAAGRAYAVNVLGCILGPIFASYVLLPWLSEKHALILLGVPFFAFLFVCRKSLPRWRRWTTGIVAGAALVGAFFFANDFEGVVSRLKNGRVRRDYAASVASFGENRNKKLFVNGIVMTTLDPVTKFMVHLPLAFHQDRPESALIICFGMGTTYRSALSWNIETTAVELVPSVTKAFGFYHADVPEILNNPKGHIIIDDGRRYLRHTREKFDVIVIDPPPPVEAAGSSLLYSTEFYALAKQHLKSHGILQAWFPGEELATFQAVVRSVDKSFPYVRCFDAYDGVGTHMLASMDPIEMRTAGELAARMPVNAGKDLMEWSTNEDLTSYLKLALAQEVSITNGLNPNLKIQITDDHPYNEYFLLRRWSPF